jgi:hypothetical protein
LICNDIYNFLVHGPQASPQIGAISFRLEPIAHQQPCAAIHGTAGRKHLSVTGRKDLVTAPFFVEPGALNLLESAS